MPKKNEIIIYTTPDGKETFEVNLKKDTVWKVGIQSSAIMKIYLPQKEGLFQSFVEYIKKY